MLARLDRLFAMFAEACETLGAADRAYGMAYLAAEEANQDDLAARIGDAERAHAECIACERRAARLATLFAILTGRIVERIGTAPPIDGRPSR